MKRLFNCILPILILITSASCSSYYKPYNYPNTKWVCSQPEMYFIVKSELDIAGKAYIEGQELDIEFSFKKENSNVYIGFISEDTDCISEKLTIFDVVVIGDCKFSKNKVVIHITSIRQDRFPIGDVKELIFYREDL